MEQRFDIEAVIRNFTDSIHGEDDIQLKNYVLAYDELRRLFKELGILFSFVESDVVDKCEILKRLNDANLEAYLSVKTMVVYECNSKVPQPSGSRTLLRLHRALKFLILFVGEIHKSEESASMPEIFRDSYAKSLSNHHGWFIRKSIGLASNTVPDKPQLIQIIFDNADHDIDTTAAEFLTIIQNVYDRVQSIYETHNLLNLP